MSNYIVIHRASNLIVNVVASSFTFTGNSEYKTIKASDKVLDKYYKLQGPKLNHALVDAGALARVSPSFLEGLKSTK